MPPADGLAAPIGGSGGAGPAVVPAPPVCLTLAVAAGAIAATVELEPASCERLFRMAAYRAVREGVLEPGEPVLARLVAGRVRERHGDVLCLASCSVELLREDGRVVAAVPFTRDVFQAFAAARIVHLLGDAAAETIAGGGLDYAFALHGAEDGHEPVPVAMTALAPASVRAATAAARAVGTPAADWIVTVLAADVVEGLAELDRLSRASGVETAGRVRARLGFDAGSRTFVRLLDRLVVARDARATETAVVSTAASWGEFLAGVDDGPQAATSVHTHLHLSEKLRAAAPLISIDDLVTHYVVFPDPLSAALVVTLFPDRSVTRLYGYAPDGRLAAEPGFWIETRGEDA